MKGRSVALIIVEMGVDDGNFHSHSIDGYPNIHLKRRLEIAVASREENGQTELVV